MSSRQRDFSVSVERLERHDDVSVRQLGHALLRTHDETLSAEERRGLDSIERLRADLAESTEEITGIDYGADNPSEPRPRDVAREGVCTTFAVGRDLTLGSSAGAPWAHLIFNLVRLLKPNRCLELGTCIGLSAAYECAGLEMNGSGLLVTLEGNKRSASLAKANLTQLGQSRFQIVVGRFEDTLPGVLRDFGSFDFMFIDGHHDGDAMVDYFLTALPHLSHDAVLLFDDIRWSTSMQHGWQTISDHRHVRIVVDLGQLGLCRLGGEDESRYSLSVRLA